MPIFIGVDPGANGGIAALSDFPGEVGEATMTEFTLKLKDCTERDIAQWIEFINVGEPYAVIEAVSSSPQMGVVSAFSFGRSYGFLRGILAGMAIRYVEVRPRKWQSDMGCLTKGDKNVSKARAQQMYPWMKVTHAIADALLLATYCRRHHKDLF